ncbi:MAG: hypothetical protein SFV54_21755 [Bryobacteraceae bacterium]|nr:hypothetical protein [Bryobacteraceae bacterium]
MQENFHQFRFSSHKEKEMADLRKFMPVLAVLVLLSVASPAFGQLTCSTTTGVPPLVRAEGITELVGDIVYVCSTPDPDGPAGPLPAQTFPQPIVVNIQIFLNTNVTSQLLDSVGTSEALLLINEPSATTTPAIQLGVNARQGTIPPGVNNSVSWLGVPLLPAGSSTVTIRITNVRANASGAPAGVGGIPGQINAFISISGSTSVSLQQVSQTVAFVQPGLTTDATSLTLQQCFGRNTSFGSSVNITDVTFIRFNEGFATAFKPRTSTAPPYAVDQRPSVPGVSYNSESGFLLPDGVNNTIGLADFATRLQAAFTNVPNGARVFVSNAPVGILNSGSARIAGSTRAAGNGGVAPDGSPSSYINASLVVPSSPTARSFAPFFNTGSASSGTGQISAFGVTFPTGTFDVGTGANTNTGYAGGWSEISVSGNAATAAWSVSNSDPSAQESLIFAVAIGYTPNPAAGVPSIGAPMAATLSFNPLSSVTVASGTDVDVPRFVNTSQPRNLYTIVACVTNLLYPFVTTAPGFDTGIAISNTSLDTPVFTGTPAQNGTCTLYFYRDGALNPATPPVTPTIAAGATYSFSMATGDAAATPAIPAITGFNRGYLIARCAFQFAHGYAFVSDLGLTTFAQSYVALVIPDRVNNVRLPDPNTTAPGGSGEQLNQ